ESNESPNSHKGESVCVQFSGMWITLGRRLGLLRCRAVLLPSGGGQYGIRPRLLSPQGGRGGSGGRDCWPREGSPGPSRARAPLCRACRLNRIRTGARRLAPCHCSLTPICAAFSQQRGAIVGARETHLAKWSFNHFDWARAARSREGAFYA